MYTFGAQQFPGAYDPTDQTEDLGNDHFRAGEMAVSNLKIIMKNFEQEPDGHSIYLFCGKRCDRIKVLFKETDGYILLLE